MDTSRQIPDDLQEQVNQMREYSHGVTRIRVTLDDGSHYSDVYVAWGEEVIKVGTSEKIPFDASKIIKVAKQ